MAGTRPLVLASIVLVATVAAAQPRGHRPPATAHPAPTPTPPAAPPAESELISVPVPEVDGMLRRMRVYLFEPAADATAYGLGGLGTGHRVWALLPSCRPADPDDPRDPCAVDHLVFEAMGGGTAHASEPQGLTNAPDARRVQSFVVPNEVGRVRIRVVGSQNRVRYEAVVEAARLVDLPSPEGEAHPDGFGFDLTQYPAR